MKRAAAEIIREYGPFPGVERVNGVTYDGQNVWFASGDKLNALDPGSGKMLRSIDIASHAGTAFDGKHLFQIAEDRIYKIDPQSGRVLATIPAPAGGGDSGLAWAEGSLWVGEYRARKIHQIDPQTGVVLRSIESNRFVTGVTWVDGELWHGTWEGDESDVYASIRRPAKRWNASTCRPTSACPASSPTAPISSSAAAATAARCAQSEGQNGNDARGRECPPGRIERFRAKWTPVRVKKTRQNKNLKLQF
jgi:outer membrane protein assembly factor BamB